MTTQPQQPEPSNKPIPSHIDLFPARVTIEPDKDIPYEPSTFDRVRVRTDGPVLEVWAESRTYPHEPELVYTSTVSDEIHNTLGPRFPLSQQKATLVTDDAVVAITRSGGCGCGSRLYSLPQTRYQQQAERSQLMQALHDHFPNASF